MPQTNNRSMRWLDSLRGNDSYRHVARVADIAQGTLTRQLNSDALTFESVRSISRAYGRPVLADLVTLGHLSPDDVGGDDVENALRAANDEQLVLEIARRLDLTDVGLYDKPISEARGTAERHLRAVANDSIDEHPGYTDADFDNA